VQDDGRDQVLCAVGKVTEAEGKNEEWNGRRPNASMEEGKQQSCSIDAPSGKRVPAPTASEASNKKIAGDHGAGECQRL
jgi:hypothetical protein